MEKNIHPLYLEAVKKRIEGNFNETINEKELANEVGVSVSKLQKDFPLFFGSNIQDFQTEIRINKAKTLLLNTNYSVKRIAREVGYKSVDGFARAFKKITGLPPSIYRKNLSD